MNDPERVPLALCSTHPPLIESLRTVPRCRRADGSRKASKSTRTVSATGTKTPLTTPVNRCGCPWASSCVTPTAPVVVDLVLTVPEGAPAPRVDLRDAAVQARDAGGNAWSARADSSGTAIFHALPPGQYRIELDLTGLKEPLLTRGELPGFTVEAGHEVPALTIPLYPRPIRFAPPGPGGPGHS